MREILFRGKRADTKEWIYGYYFKADNKDMIQTEDFYTDVIPETVGEFTGVCDKNGKEIFEGDIVIDKIRVRENKNGEWIYRYCKYIVEFCSGSFDLKSIYGRIVNRPVDCLEVVGNIVDNPKLLEVKE